MVALAWVSAVVPSDSDTPGSTMPCIDNTSAVGASAASARQAAWNSVFVLWAMSDSRTLSSGAHASVVPSHPDGRASAQGWVPLASNARALTLAKITVDSSSVPVSKNGCGASMMSARASPSRTASSACPVPDRAGRHRVVGLTSTSAAQRVLGLRGRGERSGAVAPARGGDRGGELVHGLGRGRAVRARVRPWGRYGGAGEGGGDGRGARGQTRGFRRRAGIGRDHVHGSP